MCVFAVIYDNIVVILEANSRRRWSPCQFRVSEPMGVFGAQFWARNLEWLGFWAPPQLSLPRNTTGDASAPSFCLVFCKSLPEEGPFQGRNVAFLACFMANLFNKLYRVFLKKQQLLSHFLSHFSPQKHTRLPSWSPTTARMRAGRTSGTAGAVSSTKTAGVSSETRARPEAGSG